MITAFSSFLASEEEEIGLLVKDSSASSASSASSFSCLREVWVLEGELGVVNLCVGLGVPSMGTREGEMASNNIIRF